MTTLISIALDPDGDSSIKFELLSPVTVFGKRRLTALVQATVLGPQIIHFRAHKAAIAVCGRTNDRFTAHIETGIYQHRASRLPAERFDNLPVQWIRFTAHGLNT